LRDPGQLALDFLDELLNLARRGFGLLALDAEQKALELLVGEPGVQDAGQNDRQRDDGDEDGSVFIKKPAAGNAETGCVSPSLRLSIIDSHRLLCVRPIRLWRSGPAHIESEGWRKDLDLAILSNRRLKSFR
jgi:hypothetical protein